MKGSVLRRYAKALFEAAKEERVMDEVFRGVKDLEGVLDKGIIEFLSLPTVPFEDKADLLKDLQERLGLHPLITNTLLILEQKDKGRYILDLLSYYIQLYMEEKGYVVAEVKAARKLSNSEEEILKKRIAELTRRETFLKTEVEPELIGGLVIKIGDLLIDNSVLKKIRDFAENLKGERI